MIADMLRRATAEDHKETEASFPLLSPDLTRARYRDALVRLHGMVAGWEHLAATEAPPIVRSLLEPRARLDALEADLRTLGGASAAPTWTPSRADWPASTAAWLGAMYVMEGSRLGGLYLAHSLEPQLSLQPGHGTAYLRGFGRDTQKHWKEFLAALEEAVSLRHSGEAILGARWMFASFRGWFATPQPAAS